MTPTKIGQRVRVVPEFLDRTELSLGIIYVVSRVTTYEDDQPTKIHIDGQPEAVYADYTFTVDPAP